MAFLEVGDLTIYHELHGDGPPLLHISGSGGDLRQTAPDRHTLNDDFLSLHYDQRGLGQTSGGHGQPTMADFADDAAALCVELEWRRCHVMGTSFGGMVAQHLAIRHPQLVHKLVLNCTSPGGDQPSYPLHELQSLSGERRAEISLSNIDTRYEPGGVIPGLEGLTDYLRNGYSAERSAEAAAGFTRQLEARRHHDANLGLPSIAAPTLVCAGRFDGIAPVGNSESIVAAVPNAELDVFEGGPHLHDAGPAGDGSDPRVSARLSNTSARAAVGALGVALASTLTTGFRSAAALTTGFRSAAALTTGFRSAALRAATLGSAAALAAGLRPTLALGSAALGPRPCPCRHSFACVPSDGAAGCCGDSRRRRGCRVRDADLRARRGARAASHPRPREAS